MVNGGAFFSILYFIIAGVYMFWGIYVYMLNPNEGVNKTFFAFCVALFMWAIGLSVSTSIPDIHTAIFFVRVANIGKVAVFSLVLHFVLLLANKDVSPTYRKLFLLVHIPALINMYIFGFSSTIGFAPYNMVETDFGWTYAQIHNVWGIVYYAYYIPYVISSLIIMEKWKREFKNKSIVKQVNVLIVTFLVAFILGSFIDIVLPLLINIPLPKVTPLFALVPVGAMYYSIRYFYVLNFKKVEKDEIIFSQNQQKILIEYLAFAICASSIVSFVFEYYSKLSFAGGNLLISLLLSGLLLGFGISIFFIQNIRKKNVRDTLTNVILVASIPFVTLRFLDYFTITIWVYPIIIMVSSLLFNKRTLLTSSAIMAMSTQVLVWLLRPEGHVFIDKFDYLLRISFYLVLLLMGIFINKIYSSKIKDNENQIDFQQVIAKDSFDFISIRPENFDRKVYHLHTSIGTFFQVDRVSLYTINEEKNTVTCINEWFNPILELESLVFQEVSLDIFPWLIEQIQDSEFTCIEDITKLAKDASLEKEHWLAHKIKSLVVIPIKTEDEVYGFIGVESIHSAKKWSEEDLKRISIMGNLLATGVNQIQSDAEIQFMAYNDHLTKLPNRFLFTKRLNREIQLAKSTKELVGVVFLDLDGFKFVNDVIGHQGGDVLLKEVAKGLISKLDNESFLARFTGDEFVIMIPSDLDSRVIMNKMDEIMELFATTFKVGNQEFSITASAGIAMFPWDDENSETLIKYANIAMQQAKLKGKNQYISITNRMKEEVETSLQLAYDLQHALERDELVVYYQPQIELLTSQVTGLEALVYWNHPDKGKINPGLFIPLAEHNGLINDIGEWVLKTASTQNKQWQDMGLPHVNMGVNVSPVQLINPNIVKNIGEVISESGLDAKYIELEVTESVVIEDTEQIKTIMDGLKNIGVSIAIDDFGMKYSSLNRLKFLPIDRVKIDLQFIKHLNSNNTDRVITTGIIDLAKKLGLNVLAEGVETIWQLEFLTQKGCDSIQGFFYYKPMLAEEIEKILRNNLK